MRRVQADTTRPRASRITDWDGHPLHLSPSPAARRFACHSPPDYIPAPILDPSPAHTIPLSKQAIPSLVRPPPVYSSRSVSHGTPHWTTNRGVSHVRQARRLAVDSSFIPHTSSFLITSHYLPHLSNGSRGVSQVAPPQCVALRARGGGALLSNGFFSAFALFRWIPVSSLWYPEAQDKPHDDCWLGLGAGTLDFPAGGVLFAVWLQITRRRPLDSSLQFLVSSLQAFTPVRAVKERRVSASALQ